MKACTAAIFRIAFILNFHKTGCHVEKDYAKRSGLLKYQDNQVPFLPFTVQDFHKNTP